MSQVGSHYGLAYLACCNYNGLGKHHKQWIQGEYLLEEEL